MKTSYSCNTGIYSGIEPVTLRDSNRDPNQGYVQHAYDIVVDTSQIGQGRNQRIKLILRRHQETANRLGSPVIIGAWGAFGWSADQAIVASAHAIQRKFEKLLCGDTYWDYGRKIA